MKTSQHLTTSPQLTRWADQLEARGLTPIAIPLLDLLQVWGFIGGQLLWMLAPLFGQSTLAPLAETLEEPEALGALQAQLIEREHRRG
ncbi:MAG: hypothetical protein ACLFTI_13800 [Anaerolineales bacterium]